MIYKETFPIRLLFLNLLANGLNIYTPKRFDARKKEFVYRADKKISREISLSGLLLDYNSR
jgi:hypothetical protein